MPGRHSITKTVTIVTIWEAETEVELTDAQYADLVANGEFPAAAYDELDTQDAHLVSWKKKED